MGSGTNLRVGLGSFAFDRFFDDVVLVSIGSTLNRLGGVDDDMVRKLRNGSNLWDWKLLYLHYKNGSMTLASLNVA